MLASNRSANSLLLSAICGLALLPLDTQASGFRVPEISIAGLGLSNALVANPDEIGALAYNPAAMSFHEGTNVSLGALLLRPDINVETATGDHRSNAKENVFIPSFYGAYRLNRAWSFGLGIGAPFGLETNWEPGTFPVLSQPTTAPAHPTKSHLKLLSLTPSVAYRLNENASVSVGIDYNWAMELIFNSGGVDIKGDGEGWGWNLGFLYALDRLSFGLNYHSASTIEVEGKFQPLVALPGGPPAGFLFPAKADLALPWYAQAGVRYEFNDKLAAEFDITRTGWSEFSQIRIIGTGRGADGALLASSTNNWDDSNAYRIGISYQLTPRTQLRFGYTLDKNGQGDDFYSARVPDSDRHLFSIGLAQDLGDDWTLEAGYMYVHFEDRKYDSDVPFGAYGSDPNGTNAINGDYEAKVQIFGIGLNRSFN